MLTELTQKVKNTLDDFVLANDQAQQAARLLSEADDAAKRSSAQRENAALAARAAIAELLPFLPPKSNPDPVAPVDPAPAAPIVTQPTEATPGTPLATLLALSGGARQ